jgi:2-C-methyl-D-erythritol 4-phosphate cytidylyltransferase
MNIAVILAGGVGNRLGAGIPKQFVEILGKPILAYSIEPFDKHPDVDAILVVCVKPYVDYIWELKEKYGFKKLVWVTEGGATFQESVMNGMNYLKDKISRDDTVLFHFGASPFITSEIIADVIRVCKEKGTNAISTTDYLLLSGEKKSTKSVLDPENYTEKYIDRDTVAVMNTPHAFQYGFLLDMYEEAVTTGVINTVEPHTTTLMYALGKKIYFSKGSQTNIKITTKEDLSIFEGYVLEQQRKSQEVLSGDVVVFLADGFEECEALLVVDLLRRAGLKTVMASVMGRHDVKSSRDILVHADCLAENVDYESARLVFLPGGRLGTENLQKNEIVKAKCVDFAKDKMAAAICAAPSIFASLGILDGKKATVHPDFAGKMTGAVVLDEPVVTDGSIITGQGLGATMEFAFEIIRKLVGEETVERIKKGICYRG